MEHLSGSDVQVVLSLKRGRGFHRIFNPTTIIATLNGQKLETGCIEPEAEPEYATDLVWKTEKSILRKMRSGQEPLKIECFEMKDSGEKDKIGQILLNLRSARVVLPKDGNIDIPATWNKLFNVRNDMKAYKPEILLTLTIEEHVAYLNRKSSKETMDSCDRGMQENFLPTSQRKTLVPYLVPEEHLIQLGPLSTCRSLFFLEVTADTALNFHYFKDESCETGNYSLWYRVLENDVQLKSFDVLEKRLPINEKATIRIRSSLEILRHYLEENPYFLLMMQQNETLLGYYEIDLRPFLTSEFAEDSLKSGAGFDITSNHHCILYKQKTPRNIGDSIDNQAFLDLQLRLVYAGSKKLADIEENPDECQFIPRSEKTLESSDIPQGGFCEIDAHRNPCGDFGLCLDPDKHKVGFKYLQPDRDEPRVTNDRVQLPRSIITATNSHNYHSKSVEAYHCYCLNVNLTGIRISKSIESIEFRFHHPKAEIVSTLHPKVSLSANEKLSLQDVGCKLHFISTANEIRHLLLSYPPRVSVRDIGNEMEKASAQTIFDVDHLFARDKLESRYEAGLFDEDENEIGKMDVTMYLEDHGPYYKTHRRAPNENLGPPIMDDSLVYRIVEELEIWKERQQEIFLIDLKRKEEQHLNRLSEEWQQRRENLEAKLACSVEQCKMLANSLNMATEDLRTRRLNSLEKEARLIKANEDLQWRYDNKLKELEEAFERMEAELTSKIAILEEERSNAESLIESLRLENERLERLTKKQAEEIQVCRKNSLTEDQTAELLQDVKALEQKLANTQKSKTFFKEQWGKAVREIHRMKTEHQQALEVQIKTSKDELKNLDLEEILYADSSSLTNDQKMLGEIQKEIDVIKPRSTFLSTDPMSHRSYFPPVDSVYSSQHLAKSHRSTRISDEQDDRLRKLIEERDSLLKTGSYTIDDAIIVKLNAEIRSLLISN